MGGRVGTELCHHFWLKLSFGTGREVGDPVQWRGWFLIVPR